MIKLREDIKSNFHKDGKEKIYGKMNDPVTQVADRGEVLIVESKKGERFSVNKKLLIFS